jgi:hypothetical protein
MSFVQRITAAFTGVLPEPDVIDFVRVTLHDAHVFAYRHHAKLRAAAAKVTKPFLCAADGLPRERMKGPPAPNAMPVYEVVR